MDDGLRISSADSVVDQCMSDTAARALIAISIAFLVIAALTLWNF